MKDMEGGRDINAKQELLGRLMILACDAVKPDTQRILDLLAEYRIDHSLVIEDMDFTRQTDYFLAAKKSEGMVELSEYGYRVHLKGFLKFLNKPAGDVTSNDIRDYMTFLSEVKGNKTVSIQSSLNVLRSFFTWMHNEGLIPKNPTTRIKQFKINKKDSRHPLTPDQLEMLRNACKTYREKALVEFLYSTGCRVSEAEQIDVSDVDFERRCVSIIGKGSKRRTIYFSVKTRMLLRHYCQYTGVKALALRRNL